MIAFHGDRNIKAKYVARVKAHALADEIIHGKYWENGKGCAVGCTIHSGDHQAYEKELGIPMILARLEDRIFEGMQNGDSKEFPLRFLSAIEPGADLSLVWYQFAHWLLVDPKDGVIKFSKAERTKDAINEVASLFNRAMRGLTVEMAEWDKARRNAAAYAAAAAAVPAAAVHAAAYAAAAAAAYADARSRSRRTARDAAYVRQSAKFLELLAGAPLPQAA